MSTEDPIPMSAQPNSLPTGSTSIQDLQTELHAFLTAHTERVVALKKIWASDNLELHSTAQRPTSSITFPGI
ncbi:hypothetical protein C0991_009118 [Blastosporella zonata]|nr:hypothetical protein C0991_009118 [Blastosporella zonata]